jgi:hypothetical protein
VRRVSYEPDAKTCVARIASTASPSVPRPSSTTRVLADTRILQASEQQSPSRQARCSYRTNAATTSAPATSPVVACADSPKGARDHCHRCRGAPRPATGAFTSRGRRLSLLQSRARTGVVGAPEPGALAAAFDLRGGRVRRRVHRVLAHGSAEGVGKIRRYEAQPSREKRDAALSDRRGRHPRDDAGPSARELDAQGNARLAGETGDGRPILVVGVGDDPDFVITAFLRS